MIEGVVIKKLKDIKDNRGRLMELLRSDWPEFERFGQVYMTCVKENIVKGWHYHKKQTDNIMCFLTKVKIVLYDNRKDSGTYKELMEIVAGEENPVLVQIPPHVLHGLFGMHKHEAIVLNVPTELYNYEKPDEFRVPFDDPEVGYSWGEGVVGG